MKILSTFSYLLLLLAVILVTGKKEYELKRERCMLTLNSTHPTPNKTSFLDNPQVLYYQLNSTNDTVRYVWSLVGYPTLFMSVTGPEKEDCTQSASNSFNWEDFPGNQSHGSANISGFDSSFAFTIIFRNLIEFKNHRNKGQKDFKIHNLNDNETYNIFPLNNLTWTYHHSKSVLKGRSKDNSSSPFECDITINVPVSSDRLDYFPKTKYTENSTTFDFVFRNFDYKFGVTSRLVLEAVLVHNTIAINGTISNDFTIDDEYTPSVFQTNNYVFGKSSGNNNEKGFFQWKPISYINKDRLSTKSQQANFAHGLPMDYSNLTDIKSLATALYNETTVSNVTQMFIVFATGGDEEDDYFTYVSWTGIIGFGDPPEDTISYIVWITIFVGLGVPALLTLLGGFYVIIRKKPWQKISKCLRRSNREGYEPVSQDN